MSRVASFTFSDVLDRGITAVPDILTSFTDIAAGTRDDVDVVVRSAFSKAKAQALDVELLGSIVAAVDPLARATAVIGAKYAALGGSGGVLGSTAGAVAVCQDGFGYYRHFRNGSIFWHPVSGVHEVHGAIRAKWAALGWERSVLGYPTSDQLPGADQAQRGAYNTFQGGAIHWYPPGFGGLLSGIDTDIVETLKAEVGAVAKPKRGARVKASAAERVGAATEAVSFVGEALGVGAATSMVSAVGALSSTNPSSTSMSGRLIAIDTAGVEVGKMIDILDDIGSRGAVIVPGDLPTVLGSSAGAFEVHGDIGIHYRALGGSGSVLGYPTTDETGTPDGTGRFNHFQAGSIHWSPATGAHETHGLIRAFWAAGGWERNSALGYPISDELVPDRRIGHRFPERKKKWLDLPPDVIKLPADAIVAGFSPKVANLPVGEILLARADDAVPESNATVARAAARTAGGAARVKPKIDTTKADAEISVTEAIVALPAAGTKRVDLGDARVELDRFVEVGSLFAQPSSSPGPVASDNRYGDFENGVVFWRRGASAARQLQPWSTSADGRSMRRSPAEVVAAFDDVLRPALSGLDGATYSGSSFLGTTAYTWDGASVHNRRHRVDASLVATQVVGGVFGSSVTIPVTVAVQLRLETAFDPQRRAVVVFLADWNYTDATNLTAPSLRRQLHPRLDALLYRRVDLIEVPDTDDGDPIALLSAKTLPDGSVVVFIEPDDPLIVSDAFVNISDAIKAGVLDIR